MDQTNESHGQAPRTPAPPGLPPVLFSDNRIIVFIKPPGLLSVPGIGPEKADCLAARAEAAFPGARIVHRLDRDTSGVIVMGRDADSHRELSRQFQDREVSKTYEAVVGGVMAGSSRLPVVHLPAVPNKRRCYWPARRTGWKRIEPLPALVGSSLSL